MENQELSDWDAAKIQIAATKDTIADIKAQGDLDDEDRNQLANLQEELISWRLKQTEMTQNRRSDGIEVIEQEEVALLGKQDVLSFIDQYKPEDFDEHRGLALAVNNIFRERNKELGPTFINRLNEDGVNALKEMAQKVGKIKGSGVNLKRTRTQLWELADLAQRRYELRDSRSAAAIADRAADKLEGNDVFTPGASRTRTFEDLARSARDVPGSFEVISSQIGDRILEAAHSEHDEDSSDFDMGAIRVHNILPHIEKVNPALADEYLHFISEGLLERYSHPRVQGEANIGTLRGHLHNDFNTITAYLGVVFERVVKGEEIPQEAEAFVGKMKPYFERYSADDNNPDRDSSILPQKVEVLEQWKTSGAVSYEDSLYINSESLNWLERTSFMGENPEELQANFAKIQSWLAELKESE